MIKPPDHPSGITCAYKQLSDSEKGMIKFLEKDDTIFSFNHEYIYAVNGLQMYDLISAEDKVILYQWSPNCHSSVCLPLKSAQDLSKKYNAKLIVVVEYYDMPQIIAQIDDVEDFPLFSVNHKYYKTRFCNKYFKKFNNDINGRFNLSKEELWSRFYLYEKGKLVSTDIQDIFPELK